MKISCKLWNRCCCYVWQIATQIYFTALRWLRRLPAPQHDGNPTTDKLIYLTFDDGPSLYTQKLLNVLERYNVKATFFVTNGANRLDVLPRISAAGHSIGNHTANHDYKTLYASETSFLEAICKMDEIILDKTGVRPTLFRFPGGSESIHYYAPTLNWHAS